MSVFSCDCSTFIFKALSGALLNKRWDNVRGFAFYCLFAANVLISPFSLFVSGKRFECASSGDGKNPPPARHQQKEAVLSLWLWKHPNFPSGVRPRRFSYRVYLSSDHKPSQIASRRYRLDFLIFPISLNIIHPWRTRVSRRKEEIPSKRASINFLSAASEIPSQQSFWSVYVNVDIHSQFCLLSIFFLRALPN